MGHSNLRDDFPAPQSGRSMMCSCCIGWEQQPKQKLGQEKREKENTKKSRGILPGFEASSDNRNVGSEIVWSFAQLQERKPFRTLTQQFTAHCAPLVEAAAEHPQPRWDPTSPAACSHPQHLSLLQFSPYGTIDNAQFCFHFLPAIAHSGYIGVG